MEKIQQFIEEIINNPRPAVLAMIVGVEGSAYRKEGAWMLFRENDSQMGVISGGCLENDLHNRAQKMFNTGETAIYRYDLSAEDDLGWGRGAGCNGIVSIMLRDITLEFRRALTFVYEQLLVKNPVYYIQSMLDFNAYSFRSASGEQYGNTDEVIPAKLDDIVPFLNVAGQDYIGDEMVYRQLIWPQPDLYIIGTGIDARPLAHLADSVGYAVHMIDWRESMCNEVHFPTAKSFQVCSVEKLSENISFSPLDSVVVMTHDFQKDLSIIRQIGPIQLLYFGVLGSRKRTLRLFEGEVPHWIHSPVGLSIGAVGPEEIAVSIVAEMITIKRGKESENRGYLPCGRKQQSYGIK